MRIRADGSGTVPTPLCDASADMSIWATDPSERVAVGTGIPVSTIPRLIGEIRLPLESISPEINAARSDSEMAVPGT